MLDLNTEVLFELIRAGLWGEAGANLNVTHNLNEDVDWNEVYMLAQEQSVLGLVLQGIEWFKNHNLNLNDNASDGAKSMPQINLNIPQVLLLQWIGEVQIIEQRNKEMNVFIADLIEKLRKADISALLVKGQGVAQCYEKPLWRSSGDVDLLLDDEDYDKAKAFLAPLASSVATEYANEKHLGMTIDGWVVELHGTLHGGLSSRINQELDDIQTDTFYGGNVHYWMNGQTKIILLGKENDIVYVFVHFLNHFYKEGVGLRQICDWCRLMWTYRDEIDVEKIESRIRKMGLVSEWKAFGTLAIEYLGFPKDSMPLLNISDDLSANLKQKADRIIEFVLKSGNMGHSRDMSHFSKYPYLIRKCVSMGRRISDLINHAMIFPLDSLRFFPRIMWNGVVSAMRGE